MRSILIIILFTLPLSLLSQVRSPIWVFPTCGKTINGIAIGLADTKFSDNSNSCHTNVNGVKIELIGLGIGAGFLNYSPAIDTVKAYNFLSDSLFTINGISLSFFGSILPRMNMNGVTACIFFQAFNSVNGIMFAFGGNSGTEVKGAQFSFIGNDALVMQGVQLTLGLNKADQIDGVQIGLVNKTRILNGLQIGLWNVNQNRSLPIVNW